MIILILILYFDKQPIKILLISKGDNGATRYSSSLRGPQKTTKISWKKLHYERQTLVSRHTSGVENLLTVFTADWGRSSIKFAETLATIVPFTILTVTFFRNHGRSCHVG